MEDNTFGSTKHATSYIVIPARLESTRLPRKLLLSETGQPVIQHTYEAASQSSKVAGVCVAADHTEIAKAVHAFGGRVVMTSASARSGTDRVAEVAESLTGVDIIVNVQGDEPEIAVQAIDLVVDLLQRNPSAVMSTVATPIRDAEKLHDPACVKAVFDDHGKALYFSRAAIPHVRDWNEQLLNDSQPHFFQHLGLYAYRRDFLLKLATLPQSDAEKLENLEQLRVLAAGHTILVGTVDEPTAGIDTAADYRAFVSRHHQRRMSAKAA
ncbi:MAG: 3-deoxy-manno-octulosonate cytidylyltransferase [Planctomycetales bacterium]|nr:3-deoxy-manno-octulosonate cytidylyltransferase [Planctomycetales bacterium]